MGIDYLILAHLAKRHGLKIKDIPSDGNYDFHAVGLPCFGCSAEHHWAWYIAKADWVFGDHAFQGLLCWLQSTPVASYSAAEKWEWHVCLMCCEMADNLAVQGVADRLDLNIEVINTITAEWPHNVHLRDRRSKSTITIGALCGTRQCSVWVQSGIWSQKENTSPRRWGRQNLFWANK